MEAAGKTELEEDGRGSPEKRDKLFRPSTQSLPDIKTLLGKKLIDEERGIEGDPKGEGPNRF